MKYGDKEVVFKNAPNTIGIKISFKEGGEVPAELSGLYTSSAEAERAILAYQDGVAYNKAMRRATADKGE
jgi:hypothetical protein